MMETTTGSGASDGDEIRRLLYMALLANRTERYELAGTLVNALMHHQQLPDLTFGEASENVVAAIEGETSGQAWVTEQVARITGELGWLVADQQREHVDGEPG